MFFIVDSLDQSILAFDKRGNAARALLEKAGIEVQPGQDPVQLANQHSTDRFVILNLSGAFEAISQSDDQAAQELAAQFKQAVDARFK